MHISFPFGRSLFCFLAVALTTARAGDAGIAANGDFQAPPSSSGGVAEWTIKGDPSQVKVVEEGGSQFLRLALPSQGYLQVLQQFPVGNDWKGLEISARIRVEGLQKGPESYNTVTLLYTFEDAKGEHLGEWTQHMCDTDQDWTPFEVKLDQIPAGARTLTVACSIMNASATADFDDIVVKPITASGN